MQCDTVPYTVGHGLQIYDITEQQRRQRQLEQANERLEQFTNVVSHDLRNPIQVAQGRLKLAREGDAASFDRVEDALDGMNDNGTLYVEDDGPGIPADKRETSWSTVTPANRTRPVWTRHRP